MGTRRSALFVTLVCAAFGTGVAFAGAPVSVGTPTGTVVMLGDSNLVLSGSDLNRTALDRNFPYTVVELARSFATIRFGDCASTTCATYDYWQHRLDAVQQSVDGDVYVVDLGINDTVEAGTATSPGYSSYGAKIDWLLAQIGSVTVLWSNLPCRIEPRVLAAGCAAVNKALAAAPARHSNLHIINWARVADRHPEYLGPPAGVHLTTASGRRAWAKFVANQLDARFKVPS